MNLGVNNYLLFIFLVYKIIDRIYGFNNPSLFFS